MENDRARDIIDKAALTTDRLKTIIDLMYDLALASDGAKPETMTKNLHKIIPLFEYVQRDIAAVDGAFHGIFHAVYGGDKAAAA